MRNRASRSHGGNLSHVCLILLRDRALFEKPRGPSCLNACIFPPLACVYQGAPQDQPAVALFVLGGGAPPWGEILGAVQLHQTPLPCGCC